MNDEARRNDKAPMTKPTVLANVHTEERQRGLSVALLLTPTFRPVGSAWETEISRFNGLNPRGQCPLSAVGCLVRIRKLLKTA
jgi:hypothetical protein